MVIPNYEQRHVIFDERVLNYFLALKKDNNEESKVALLLAMVEFDEKYKKALSVQVPAILYSVDVASFEYFNSTKKDNWELYYSYDSKQLLSLSLQRKCTDLAIHLVEKGYFDPNKNAFQLRYLIQSQDSFDYFAPYCARFKDTLTCSQFLYLILKDALSCYDDAVVDRACAILMLVRDNQPEYFKDFVLDSLNQTTEKKNIAAFILQSQSTQLLQALVQDCNLFTTEQIYKKNKNFKAITCLRARAVLSVVNDTVLRSSNVKRKLRPIEEVMQFYSVFFGECEKSNILTGKVLFNTKELLMSEFLLQTLRKHRRFLGEYVDKKQHIPVQAVEFLINCWPKNNFFTKALEGAGLDKLVGDYKNDLQLMDKVKQDYLILQSNIPLGEVKNTQEVRKFKI